MKSKWILITVTIFIVGILAGCSAAPSVEPTQQATPVPMDTITPEIPATSTIEATKVTQTLAVTSEVSASPSVGDDFKVEIEDFAFTPKTLTIKVGTTVTWTNKDNVGHTATSDSGVFDSGLLYKGDSYSYTFTKTGTFSYFCTPHPYMVATIVVTE